MIGMSGLITHYLRGILRISRARSVSLFVPVPRGASPGTLLLHEGKEPRVPELASLERAVAFDAGIEAATEAPGRFPRFLPSADPHGVLFALPPIPLRIAADDPTVASRRRRLDQPDPADELLRAGWMGLGFAPGAGSPSERLMAVLDRRGADALSASSLWSWITTLGGGLALHATEVSAMLRDSVTGLPGRQAFHLLLDQEFRSARERKQPLGLLSINPDSFVLLNERFGREAADEIIRDFASQIRSAFRASDRAARYGGVTFAVLLPGASLAESMAVGEKVRRAVRDRTFLRGAARLSASVGVSAFDPAKNDISRPEELLRRADQALSAAKRSGGDRLAAWTPGSDAAHADGFDRLNGIFTGRMAVDYRNMGLLWDAMNVISRLDEPEGLAAQIVSRIDGAFAPRRTALFVRSGVDDLKFLYGIVRDVASPGLPRIEERPALNPEETTLIEQASENGRCLEARIAMSGGEEPAMLHAIATPLLSRDRRLGVLLLESLRPLDLSDTTFLAGLGRQLGAAFERIELTADEARRRYEEKTRLEEELSRYRQAVDRSRFLYRSPLMDELLERTRQVASTDETVLISGESGTGKELLARTLHELSARRARPLSVVDCSAISTTLIDSELFGHEAGAYTGAQQRRVGRLAEADGGTLLLDEIGELPLDVQGKLLRFVQAKQFTAVGSSRQRDVDVRIIAATNRDLAAEVAAGKFRQDLYHRLHVVSLVVPPLRERGEDVLHLAEHFLGNASTLYRKDPPRRLGETARLALLRHPWPGNVRELQHRITQAVIFCSHEELSPADLGLAETGLAAATRTQSFRPAATAEDGAPDDGDPWTALRAGLVSLMDGFARGGSPSALPLGRWLAADLVLEAESAALGSGRRGASLLGMPEATFRHRLRNAKSDVSLGVPRPARWSGVRSALARIARTPRPDGENRLERVENTLLEEVVARFPGDQRLGALVLGVTIPTLRRRLQSPADSQRRAAIPAR